MENRGSKADARRRSEMRIESKLAKADQRTKDVMDFQRRRQEVEEAKLLRLRAQRLAKEAVDRESAEKAAETALSVPTRRVRRVTGSAK